MQPNAVAICFTPLVAVQFARGIGYRTIALSNGESKRDFAIKLGAHKYIDSSKEDVIKKLQEIGGADMVCTTAPNPAVISSIVGALAPGGDLWVLAANVIIDFNTISMINNRFLVHEWASGYALDS